MEPASIGLLKHAVGWLVTATASIILLLWIQRQRTKRMLERCGLPTVFWRPRFVTYTPFEQQDQKLASTTITRILPRMKRLGGPYGMYGTVYGVATPVVHIAHPVPAKAILNGISSGKESTLASSDNTKTAQRRRSSSSVIHSTGASKAPAYNHFKNFCGEGVFTADGDDWKAKRTAVMHNLIKGTNLAGSAISIKLEQEANRAADVFCQQVESLKEVNTDSHATTTTTISVPNVVPLLQRATIGLIYHYITHDEPNWNAPRAAVGACENSSDNDDDDDAAVESLSISSSEDGSAPFNEESESLVTSYLNSIVRIRMIILAQSRSIWFILPRWCYKCFSSLYRDEEATLGPIREFARRACDKAKPTSPLFKLSVNEGPHQSQSKDWTTLGKGIDRFISKNLLDEAITLLFAGQDTSAATLSWTLHLLSLHPQIQDKLAAEVRKAFTEEIGSHVSFAPDEPSLPLITRKLISKMPYLDAVIKEAMRLYPVAPFIVRRLTESIPIPFDGEKKVIIPSGAVACIWIYSLHRNSEFWNRPDDFLPERWLDPELKDVGQTNGAYMPFASGPRNCLGQPLAHIILRTLLSKLVYQYEFIDPKLNEHSGTTHSEKQKLRKDMQAGFTVLPTGGVELMLRCRNDNKTKTC